MRVWWGLGVVCSAWALACGDPAVRQPQPPTSLTLLHTSDIHSRLWPYRSRISSFDAELGLGKAGALDEVGGVARLTTLLDAERERGATLWLDSGDALEGAPVFRRYGGHLELELLSSLGLAAMALGNHELSLSGAQLGEVLASSARFPVLAANLEPLAASALFGRVLPSAIVATAGVRIGVVGVANPTSPPNLATPANPWQLELQPDLAAAVQAAVDQIGPEVALVVVLSHLGLDQDRALVQATTGIDLVLGGHQHIVTAEPEWQDDCATPAVQDERSCSPRRVPIVHSGAYGRWLSRLELTLASARATPQQLEITALVVRHLPLAAKVAADPRVSEFLEARRPAPQPPVGFLPEGLPRRSALGGDSPLGNLTVDAMRAATSADVAVVNSSALRGDLEPGALLRSELELAFPFDEPWRLALLSGRELRQGLLRAAWRSTAQGCVSTLQVAGLRLTIQCQRCQLRADDCVEITRVAPPRELALSDDQELLVALPEYLTLTGADFDVAAARGAEVTGSVADVIASSMRQRSPVGETGPCVDALVGLSEARCREAFGALACPLTDAQARAACRSLPLVRGERDDRIQMLP